MTSKSYRARMEAKEKLRRRRVRGKLADEGVVLSGGVTPQMVYAAHRVYVDTISALDFPFSDMQMVSTMLAAALGEKSASAGKSDEGFNTYFVTDGNSIKIGSAGSVAKRMAALQTAHPLPLSLLGIVAGGPGTERDFHERFGEYRVRGEWFRNEGALREFVEVNFTGQGVVVISEEGCRFGGCAEYVTTTPDSVRPPLFL